MFIMAIMAAALITCLRCGAQEPRDTRFCIKRWTPGNVVISALTSVYSGVDAPPPCPVFDAFYNDLRDDDAGRDYRPVLQAGDSYPVLYPPNAEITEEELSQLTIGRGADIRFGHFHLELGRFVHNRGDWSLLTDHDIRPFEGVTGSFLNTGTFRKRASTGSSVIVLPFRDVGGNVQVEGQARLVFGDQESIFERTTFLGPGTIAFTNGATLTAITNAGARLELAGGSFRGSVDGETTWNGGTLFLGNLGNAPFDNHGILKIPDGEPRFMNSGAILQNFDTLELASGISLLKETAVGFVETTVYNYALIRKEANPTTNTLGNVRIINHRGTLALGGSNGVTVVHSSWIDFAGTLHVPQGVLELQGRDTRLEGTTLTGSGTVRLKNGGHISRVTNLSSTLELAGGRLTGTNNGRVSWTGGEVSQFVNLGTFLVHSNALEKPSVVGSFYNDGHVEGTGPITVPSPNSFFYNSGRLSPGFGLGSLEVLGSVALQREGELVLEIAGPVWSQQDHLIATTRLHLAGRIRVVLTNGYVPAAGDRFQLLDSTHRTGAFDSVALPSLPSGLFWRSEMLESDGSLAVGLAPASVESWRSSYFSEPQLADIAYSGETADPDGDGVINLFELLFGLSPIAPETAETRRHLPRAIIDRHEGSSRLVVELSLPELMPERGFLQLDVLGDLTVGPWKSIAIKRGNEPWTGPGTVDASPPVHGRVHVRVLDSEPAAATARYMRVKGGISAD